MIMSVCLYSSVSQNLHMRTSPDFLCKLPVAVSWTFSVVIAICCVLPVLWIAETAEDDRIKRLNEWKDNMENSGMRGSMNMPRL